MNYDGNGATTGTAPSDNQTYLETANVTTLGNTGNLVKTGYTFDGWNTKADGSGTSYAENASFNMGTSNITLYAQWKANATYTVNYDGNEATTGTASSDNQTYLETANVTALGNTGNLVKTGYTFDGWNTKADGSGTSYAGNATFKMGSTNVILYAKWNKNSDSIDNGGSDPSPSNGNTRQADVTTNSNINESVAKIDINRINENDKKIDEVQLDQKTTEDVIQRALEQKNDTTKIIVTDLPNDPADEIKVNINSDALGLLSNHQFSLQIGTPSGFIILPKETVQSINEKGMNLTFTVTPIRNEKQKQPVIQEVMTSNTVQEAVGDKANDIKFYGSPTIIETNYTNNKTQVSFPLTGIDFQGDDTARTAFLNTLRVYVKHTDGTEELLKGDIQFDEKGNPKSLTIGINKFSTFTLISVPNIVPTVNDVKITGQTIVNHTLEATYTYQDKDGDKEGSSMIQWYRADDEKGKNKQAISGATQATYQLTAKDDKKYISYSVTPVAKTGAQQGIEVTSQIVGAVQKANTAPKVSQLSITGKAILGTTLKASYIYSDTDKDQQGKSIIQWYRMNPKTNKKVAIKGANRTSYKVTSKDVGNLLVFEVQPSAKTGLQTGKKVMSKKTSIIEEYKGHLKVVVNKGKVDAIKLVTILEKTYKAKNVTLKKDGVYYRISADFINPKQATTVGKSIKKKKFIQNYSVS